MTASPRRASRLAIADSREAAAPAPPVPEELAAAAPLPATARESGAGGQQPRGSDTCGDDHCSERGDPGDHRDRYDVYAQGSWTRPAWRRPRRARRPTGPGRRASTGSGARPGRDHPRAGRLRCRRVHGDTVGARAGVTGARGRPSRSGLVGTGSDDAAGAAVALAVPGTPGGDDLDAGARVGGAHHHAAADVHGDVVRTAAEVEQQVARAQLDCG